MEDPNPLPFATPGPYPFPLWNANEERTLCHLLLNRFGRDCMSCEPGLAAVIQRAARHIRVLCVRAEGSTQITPLDIAHKMEKVRNRHAAFVNWMNLEGIFYDENRNKVHAIEPYFTNMNNRELDGYRLWRRDGEPNFVGWRKLFVEAGINHIDFRRLNDLLTAGPTVVESSVAPVEGIPVAVPALVGHAAVFVPSPYGVELQVGTLQYGEAWDVYGFLAT